MSIYLRRREFITALGGAAAWPLAARAQQRERVRRLGVLYGNPEDDPATRANFAALRGELANLGWIEGRNLRIDPRFTGSDPDRMRAYALELVSFAPDVIITSSRPATTAVQEQTQTIPIVFTAGQGHRARDRRRGHCRARGQGGDRHDTHRLCRRG
jgi:putative ABC transport system substrate-binding protein